MILRDRPQRIPDFVARFSSLAGWVKSGSSDEHAARALLATATDEAFPGAVLPRRSQGRTIYYAVTDSMQEWRSLAPLLKAFVGVTITDFAGLVTAMDPDDPLEGWLASCGFAAIARITPGRDPLHSRIAEAGLLRLHECLHLPDLPQKARPRSTRQVLEDFRMALAAAHRESAEASIAFLRTTMRLDAMNLCFLEVQLDATLGEWERLRKRPFFRELCFTRRPPSVTVAMLKAIYHVDIEPVESTGGPGMALATFRSEVLPRVGTLFAASPPSSEPLVGVMFLLAAIAGDAVDQAAVTRLTELTSDWPEEGVRSFNGYLALAGHPAGESPPTITFSWASLLNLLQAAVDSTSTPTVERARAVLLGATAIQTLEAYRTAVDCVSRLPRPAQEELLSSPGYATLWDGILRHAAGNRVPRNLREWVELLSEMTFEQARACIEQATTEWPISHELQKPSDVEDLIAALGSVGQAEEDRLYDALPDLLIWVQSDDHWPNPSYLSLYERLVTLFVLGNRRTADSLQALMLLLEGMLEVGLPSPDYVRLLDDIAELVRQLDATSYLNWLIDLAELTATYSCPEPGARHNLWTQIIAVVGHFATRLSGSQLAVLRELALILEVPDALTSIERAAVALDARPVDTVRGLVAIYTLVESVGQRVARTLRDKYPDLRVEISHDHVGGRRLVELARNADLFVICWRSAKHAATTVIRQRRPADRTTIYAPGKGSSSILTEIEAHLASATE